MRCCDAHHSNGFYRGVRRESWLCVGSWGSRYAYDEIGSIKSRGANELGRGAARRPTTAASYAATADYAAAVTDQSVPESTTGIATAAGHTATPSGAPAFEFATGNPAAGDAAAD
jgi:hypothetical protein